MIHLAVKRVSEDVCYAWPDGESMPWVWHWCPAANGGEGRWVAQGTDRHTLVSREPLHLEPSLLYPCCGLHGFLRAGSWADA
ncbi:hypothetical protein [Streptomyces sp. NPDC059994]|uniref:hypothetical protein n=1 Tax=Streptomyces sp. NPDC059994 TaxID=3347029 RepID=UPI00367AA53E